MSLIFVVFVSWSTWHLLVFFSFMFFWWKTSVLVCVCVCVLPETWNDADQITREKQIHHVEHGLSLKRKQNCLIGGFAEDLVLRSGSKFTFQWKSPEGWILLRSNTQHQVVLNADSFSEFSVGEQRVNVIGIMQSICTHSIWSNVTHINMLLCEFSPVWTFFWWVLMKWSSLWCTNSLILQISGGNRIGPEECSATPERAPDGASPWVSLPTDLIISATRTLQSCNHQHGF